jgi:cytochrome d ubiquinol oxidase subunit I
MPPVPIAAADLLAARWQMALTLGAHIILAVLGVGMPVLLMAAEWKWLRTGDPVWRALALRWSRAFAVLFAVGAVSGTVLSFELGLLWPEFMAVYGGVIGLPFTLEAFAFFLEAIFVGIYLYTWDRLPPWTHWWTAVPIALSGLASAVFVVTVNAWMNRPQGFRLEGGRVVEVDPWQAMLNPAAPSQVVHMVVAAYLVCGFMVASFYAVARLRGKESEYNRRAMALGVAMGGSMALVQLAAGDWIARMVARTQPVKLAALEGQFATERGAPLRIGGWPDEEARRTPYAVEVPRGLSLLAYHDPDAEVKGLDDFPRDEIPPVAVVHVSFQVMVIAGGLLALLALWSAAAAVRRRTLPAGRAYLWSVAAAGPVSVAALEAGWIVTEVGRQPWIVQGYMRTADAVTEAPGTRWLLGASVAVYLVLLVGAAVVLRILARARTGEADHASP